MKLLPALFITLLLISACHQPLRTGLYWKEVGSVDDGFIPFVLVDAAHAKDGQVYKEAASLLTGAGAFQVGFFLPGDAIPPNGSRSAFFQPGGWGNYNPVAVYAKDGFTKWDCNRAGVDDAPLSALCGKGAEEQYNAVLDLAGRDGWVEGCNAPPINGKAVVERFAATFNEVKRDQLLAAYQQMYSESTNGPDDHSDCENLRERMDAKAAVARKTLLAAMKDRKQSPTVSEQ